MNKKGLIFILFLIIMIVLVILYKIKFSKSNDNNKNTEVKISYKKEENDDNLYTVYDENTGEKIAENVEESQLQMYKDNPNFIGSENGKNMENYENLNIVTGSVWEN